MTDKEEDAMDLPVSRAVVEAFYQAFTSNDPADIAPFIDDHATWVIAGPIDVLQICGERRGKEAILDLFERVRPALFEIVAYDPDILLVDGDRAATWGRLTALQRTTGRTISYHCSHFLRFHRNKVMEFRAVIDSYDAVEQILGHPVELIANEAPLLALM
jgi:ketosteroid isomerase-like protein